MALKLGLTSQHRQLTMRYVSTPVRAAASVFCLESFIRTSMGPDVAACTAHITKNSVSNSEVPATWEYILVGRSV